MQITLILSIVAGCAATLMTSPGFASTCTGTPAHGRVAHAVALPVTGKNFAPYTELGARLGRTYVHSTVHDIVTASYRDLERQQPDAVFVYGETGLRHGGPMPPHRTHENGTSIDFMVPVRHADGRPATLPRSAANRYGYDAEFDSEGRMGLLRIDFDAIASHLRQLDEKARKRGAGIARIIFDPALTRKLFDRPGGKQIQGLAFMKATPWIRHDEHYHVDFAIRCASG